MELYYNPEQMDESEIKRTFVARQWLLDDVLSSVVTSKPAIEGHFKTGQRAAART
jgi:hypothetical protein